tara:strand:+ start:7597 stop:10410 length:2814 start_codon:yes stop_codon:yes gene_type:complete
MNNYMQIHKIILLLIVFNVSKLYCQDVPLKNSNDQEGVIIDSLANGLKYIIKPINDEKRNFLSLVIKAGSAMEEEDQFNNAHLLEHIAFNYLFHFPNISNNDQLYIDLGVKKTNYVANTGGYRTRYIFDYPANNTRGLDTILSIYSDIISGNVIFNEHQIALERKAIYQEYFFGNSSRRYPYLKIEETLFGCTSTYPDPDHYEDFILKGSNQALKRFYRQWYQPDLATLIITGNFENIEEVREKIKQKFAAIPKPKREINSLKDCSKDILQSESYFITKNQYDTAKLQTVFQFYYRDNSNRFKGFDSSEYPFLKEILKIIINSRLQKLKHNYESKFSAYFQDNMPYPASFLEINLLENPKKSIGKVFGVLQSFKEQEITANEYRLIENYINEGTENKRYSSSRDWLNFYDQKTDHSNAGMENKKLREKLFAKLTTSTLNNLLKNYSWYPDDIAVIVPFNTSKNEYSKAQVNNWIKEGLSKAFIPEPIDKPNQLLKKIPEEAKIIDHQFGSINEDIITFENGLKVVLKSNSCISGNHKDKIMIRGFSQFGSSQFKEEEEIQADFSPQIIKYSGLAEHSYFEIRNFLQNTSILSGYNDYINKYETGFENEVVAEDLERFLALIYLSFTKPRYDAKAFEYWKYKELESFTRAPNPQIDFNDFVKQKLDMSGLPRGEKRYEQSKKIKYHKSFSLYRELHNNPSNFTVIITGNFVKKEIIPLLSRYLGSIELNKEDSSLQALDKNDISLKSFAPIKKDTITPNFPYRVKNRFLTIDYRTSLDSRTFEEEIHTELIKTAIFHRLNELRFKAQLGVYFYAATQSINYDTGTRDIQINLQCDSKDYEQVLIYCQEIIKELKNELQNESFLKLVKSSMYLPGWSNRFEPSNKSDMNRLYNSYRHKIPLVSIAQSQEYIDKLNVSDLRKIANDYLNNDNHLIFTNKI